MADHTPIAVSIPTKMHAKHDAIWALIEPFCRERLNNEYLNTCGALLRVLARKRPSPLVNGTPAAWACGIVRAIGWVNFLDDPSQTPHLKLTEVDRAFGVSSGTGQTKSKAIRDMLKLTAFEPEWTLPTRMKDNPIAWMVQVNGMIVDVRSMPRSIQEEAFARGMIPYLPSQRGAENGTDD
jgi:hypothetical protein